MWLFKTFVQVIFAFYKTRRVELYIKKGLLKGNLKA